MSALRPGRRRCYRIHTLTSTHFRVRTRKQLSRARSRQGSTIFWPSARILKVAGEQLRYRAPTRECGLLPAYIHIGRSSSTRSENPYANFSNVRRW